MQPRPRSRDRGGRSPSNAGSRTATSSSPTVAGPHRGPPDRGLGASVASVREVDGCSPLAGELAGCRQPQARPGDALAPSATAREAFELRLLLARSDPRTTVEHPD